MFPPLLSWMGSLVDWEVHLILCRSLTDKSIVLKHHPDKRKAAGEQIVEGDNDYFTCITKGTYYKVQLLSPHWHYLWNYLTLTVSVFSLWLFEPQLQRSCPTLWKGEPSTASIPPSTTQCLLRAKAKKTFLRCSLLFLREMPGGLPKSMCPPSGPWSPLLKKWIIFTLFGKRDSFFSVACWFVS